MSEKRILKLFFLVIFMLFLIGCKKSTDDSAKSVAETEKTKTELTRLKLALEKTQSESNELNEGFSETLEEIEAIKTQLSQATKARESLENQIAELAAQRDDALAKARETQALADDLAGQLKEKTDEVKALEELNEELLTTITKLQEQLEQATGGVTVEMYEETKEEP